MTTPTIDAALYRRRLRDRLALAAMRELIRKYGPDCAKQAWDTAEAMMAERARRDRAR